VSFYYSMMENAIGLKQGSLSRKQKRKMNRKEKRKRGKRK